MPSIDVLWVISSKWCLYLLFQETVCASVNFFLSCLFDKCCDLVAGRHKSAAYLAQNAKNAGITLDTVAYNTMLKANLESGIFDFLYEL